MSRRKLLTVKLILTQFLVAIVSITFVLFPVAQAAEGQTAELALPTGDLIAPNIEHALIEKDIPAGQQINIKATVTDNVGVKNVTLFYRDMNAVEFKRLKMNRNLDSFVYTVQLDAIETPGLEYYIQASDLAGNTLLFGYSFSPLTIAVAPTSTAVQADHNSTDVGVVVTSPVLIADQEKKNSGISKWVWIGLGVVVAGAALAGGGGGGGSDTNEPTTSTGIVTISGAVP
ncbi:MAG: hypothetical protein COB30_018430 [Ectothiorhodospiraceae bacterium]|nr:hypothetical protein [Ectothiorhodospiraceae bacterium]